MSKNKTWHKPKSLQELEMQLALLREEEEKKIQKEKALAKEFADNFKDDILSLEESSITFTANKVPTGQKSLQPGRVDFIVRHRCGGMTPEAHSPFPRQVVMERGNRGYTSPVNIDNGLIAALHLCWSNHYPLTLTPDMIWICIAQGFAQHINANHEKLRHKLVEHEGKKTLKVMRSDFVKGSPKNPWPEVFEEFSHQIQRNVGDKVHGMLTPSFSTTGPVEKAAAQIVLMDAFKQYFHYALLCVCGIPAITLEGTVEDWKALKEKVSSFIEYDLGWWVDAMNPVLDQFIAASSGNVDHDFWRKIYNQHGGKNAYSAGPYVTGWILSFFPYCKSWKEGTIKNKFLSLWSEVEPQEHDDKDNRGFIHSQFSAGVVSVPFILKELPDIEYQMQFYAGFMAVSQDEDSKALRPEIGWAVVSKEEMEQTIEKSKKPRRF